VTAASLNALTPRFTRNIIYSDPCA